MSLSHTQLLMNAVVDGEASPAQCREFEALAQRDPELREEFEQAQALAAMLAAMPDIEPPGDLAAVIVAKVTLSGHNARPLAQLPGGRHVNGSHAGPSSRVVNFARSIRFHKEHFMNEVKKGFLSTTRSRVLAGGALAVVALAAVSLQTNFPSSGAGTAGTIAPAERYRSGQQTDASVQSSGSTGSSNTAATTTAQQGAADNAANSSANRMMNSANAAAADKAANAAAADRSANAAAADKSANAAAADRAAALSANKSADKAANAAAADKAAALSANKSADKAANAAAADRAAALSANKAADKAANAAAADRAAAAAANRSADKAADKAANKAANAAQN